ALYSLAMLSIVPAASAVDLIGRASVIHGDTIEVHGQSSRKLSTSSTRSTRLSMDGGSTVVFREVHDATLDRWTIERFSFDDFQKLYQNKLVPISKKGATEADYIQAGKLWLNHAKRRQYLGGVTFDPTVDPTGSAPADRYNLWAGYPKTPAPGDWSLMRD